MSLCDIWWHPSPFKNSVLLYVANSDAVHVTLLDLFLQHCFLALVSKKQLLSIYLVTTVLVYKPLQMYVATQSILYLTYHLLNRSTVKLNSLPVTQPSQVHDYASFF